MSAVPKKSTKSRSNGRKVNTIFISLLVLALACLVSLLVVQVRNQGSSSDSAPPGSTVSSADRAATSRHSVAEQSTTTSTTTSAESAVAANSRLAPVASEPEETSAREAATEDESEDKSGGMAISGAVMDDRGVLLPGIQVLARQVSGPAQDPGSTTIAAGGQSQLTDELGSFAFENIGEGEYELAVAENAEYRPARLQVRAGASNAELTLQRIRSVRVFGQVADPAGEPLAEVQVRLLGTSTRSQTESTGQYEIVVEPLKAKQAPVLDFQLSGYEDTRQRVEAVVASDLAETRLDVQMEEDSSGPKTTLSGQVFGPQNESVAGAKLQLSSPNSRSYLRTTSDESGEYVFDDIEVDEGYRLAVDPPDGYAYFESDAFPVGPDGYHYQVMLEPAAYSDLSGTITDLGGAPLGGFTLWLHILGDGGAAPVQLHTDGSGRFQVQKVPVGAIKFESRSQPWLQVSGIELEPGGSQHVTVPVDWGRSWLFGRVVDDRGEPVSGARIVLQWMEHYSGLNSESRRQVMSDLEGNFTVSNLGGSGYTLTVQATGHQSSRFQYQIDQSGGELSVTLPRLDSLAQSGGSGG